MKNLFVSIILLLPFLCTAHPAQLDLGLFKKQPNQQLIEMAVNNAFVIVEQPYVVEDPQTHQQYGSYNNDYFGIGTKLGVRLDNSIVTDSGIFTPWIDDENFVLVKNTHKPILSNPIMFIPGDSVITEVKLKTNDKITKEGVLTVILSPDTTYVKGFEVYNPDRAIEGWFVLVKSKKNKKNYYEPATYSIYAGNANFSTDSIIFTPTDPLIDKEIIGGIFLIPEQTAIGQISFKIGGILCQDSQSDWKLLPIEMSEYGEAEIVTPLKIDGHVKEK